MSVIKQTIRCDWPGCGEILFLRADGPSYSDHGWEGRDHDGRGVARMHACPVHRSRGTAEFLEAIEAAADARESGEVPPRDRCPKGGSCAWKIDGQHANEYCGKCFRDRPKGE